MSAFNWQGDTNQGADLGLTDQPNLTGSSTWAVVADTLTSGSHPASNMPGRRREDHNTNFVPAAIAQNQRGELVETDYAHQLTGGGGKPGEGYAAARTAQGVRRLTPVECERLQGFPDGWTSLGGAAPDSRRYAAMGDAVTVSVAFWIGMRLAACRHEAPT